VSGEDREAAAFLPFPEAVEDPNWSPRGSRVRRRWPLVVAPAAAALALLGVVGYAVTAGQSGGTAPAARLTAATTSATAPASASAGTPTGTTRPPSVRPSRPRPTTHTTAAASKPVRPPFAGPPVTVTVQPPPVAPPITAAPQRSVTQAPVGQNPVASTSTTSLQCPAGLRVTATGTAQGSGRLTLTGPGISAEPDTAAPYTLAERSTGGTYTATMTGVTPHVAMGCY
jgi:hypothetical protein